MFGVDSRDRVLLLLSDAAAYMIRCAKNLAPFYQKMTHITCLVHGLQRVCVFGMDIFELSRKWVTLLSEVIISLIYFVDKLFI